MSAKPGIRRLLMTADTVGGVWTYALELSRALVTRDIEVHIATMGAPLTRQQWSDSAAIANLHIHESIFRLEWMKHPWADVERAAAWLLTLENEIAPDVIHLNGYAHGDLPWRAPHLVVGHSCVLSWWHSVKRREAPSEWDRYRDSTRRGLRAADCVVAPSRWMLGELQRYYGPLPCSAVVPNGRDPRYNRAAPKEPLILAAGRIWDEAKNFELFSRIRDRAPAGSPRQLSWKICVAGDTQHPDGVARGLSNVEMLGSLSHSEIAAWMSRAAIYCLPARYEPFGLSILEAALSGCALVLGDIPSLRENWDGAAAFVSPDDPDALAQQLRELASNGSLQSSLAAAARRRALVFTPRRMMDGYLGIYSEIAAANAAAVLQGE